MISRFSALLLTIAAAALLASTTAKAQDDPLWTGKPTRVAPSSQQYERLPAAKVERDSRTWLAVPERIKVIDSTSFSVGQNVYKIANLRPVRSKRICKSVEGGRWACGRMAAIFLGNLVRGKRLLCDIEQAGRKLLLSHCIVGSRDIARAIISNGYGAAEKDTALIAVQAEAQKAKAKGLWRHPECTTNFDGC